MSDFDDAVDELNAFGERSVPGTPLPSTASPKLEDSLNRLVREGLIDRADAVTRAVHPDEIL